MLKGLFRVSSYYWTSTRRTCRATIQPTFIRLTTSVMKQTQANPAEALTDERSGT